MRVLEVYWSRALSLVCEVALNEGTMMGEWAKIFKMQGKNEMHMGGAE